MTMTETESCSNSLLGLAFCRPAASFERGGVRAAICEKCRGDSDRKSSSIVTQRCPQFNHRCPCPPAPVPSPPTAHAHRCSESTRHTSARMPSSNQEPPPPCAPFFFAYSSRTRCQRSWWRFSISCCRRFSSVKLRTRSMSSALRALQQPPPFWSATFNVCKRVIDSLQSHSREQRIAAQAGGQNRQQLVGGAKEERRAPFLL